MPRRGGQSDQLAANQQEPIELDYGGEELDYNLASSRPQAAGVAGPRYNGSLPKHTITDGRQYSVEPLPRSETSQNGRQLDPRGPPRPYEPVRAATSDRPRLPDPRAAAVHRTMLRYPQGNMPGAQDSEREEGELSDETTHQSLGAGGTPSSHLPNGFAGEGYDHERSASTVPRREPYRERNHIRSQAFDYPRAQPYHPATSPLIRSPAQNRSLPPQHWRGPPYTYPSTSQSASRRSPSPRSAHAAALYAPSLPDQRAPGPRPSYEPQAKGKALELNSRAHAAPRTLRRTEEYRRNRAVASESTSVPTAAAPLNDPRASQLPERGAAPHVDPSASSVAGSVRGGTNGIDRGNTSIGTRPKPGSSSWTEHEKAEAMALVSELVSWGLPPQSLVQEGVSHEVVELCCRELGLSVPNTSAATETVHATPVPPPPPAMRPAQRPVANPESRADPSSSRAPFVRPQARTENDSKRPPPLLARIDTQSNGPIVVPSETSIDAVLPATPSVTYRAPSAAPSMEHRAESTEVSIAPGSSIVDLTTPPATATIKAHDDSPFTPGSVKPALDPQLEAELNARRRVLESMRRRAKGAVASTKPESVHGVLQPPQSDSESDYEPPEPDPEPEDDKVDGEPMQGDGHASDMDGVPLEDDEEDVDMDLGSPEAEEENEEGQIPAVESTAPMLQSAVPTAPRNHGYKDMDAPQPEVDPASMYDEESIESPEPSVPLRRARISYADDFTGRPSAPTGEVDHNAPLPTLDQPRLPPRPSPRAIAESETSSISTKPSFASFLSRPTTPIIGLRAPRNRRPVAADFDGTTPGGYGSWSAGIGRPAPRQFLPESNYRRKVVIEWSDDEEGDDESMDDNEKRQGKHDNPQLRRATAMQIFDLWLAEEMRRGSDVGFFAHPSNVASAADTSTTSRTTTPPTAPRLDRLRAAGAHVQTPGASGAENGNGMSSEARRILDQKEREIRAMMERIREIERKKNGGAPNVPDSVDAVLKSISDPDQPEAEIAAALDANTASTSANDGQGADSSKASEPVSVLNGANPAQPLEQERAQPEPLQAQPSSSSGSAQPSAFKLDPALQAQKEALLATLKAKAKASGMKRKREREIVSENKSEEGFAFDTEARESGHEKRFRWGGAGEVEATVKKEAQNIEDARTSRQDFPPEAQDDPTQTQADKVNPVETTASPEQERRSATDSLSTSSHVEEDVSDFLAAASRSEEPESAMDEMTAARPASILAQALFSQVASRFKSYISPFSRYMSLRALDNQESDMTHSSGASSSSLPSLASTAPTSATASAVQRRWCRREAAGEICEDGACRASHAVDFVDQPGHDTSQQSSNFS